MSTTMKSLKSAAIAAFIWKAAAFVPQSNKYNNAASSRVDTALDAVPPMIIGPMIRKMREEQEKKKMPMIVGDEAVGQAPGLRVGGGAWKWPPVWPYDDNFFTPPEDIPKSDASDPITNMAEMLGGGPQLPKVETPVEEKEQEVLDIMKYWAEEKADVRTEMDEEAVEKLKSHFAFYLEPGMSILEFGAAEDSYLPDDFKPSRHVGVGLNAKLMAENPSLTDTLIVDLNKVVEEEDVDSDELRALSVDKFDTIIMTNTIDFLTNPREVFRSAWNLLKPGGRMMVAFSSKKAYDKKFERAQTKMWRDFNDDQHIWVTGSLFQFSAGDGWEQLLGFNISPESAKDTMTSQGGIFDTFKQGKDNNLYVVQATKGIQEEEIDAEDPEKAIGSKMWMLPILEGRDKQLVVPRLARIYKTATSEESKKAIANNISHLPKIYEALVKMDQFAFTFPMQSQLAADLVRDPGFNGNDEQMVALRQGLGLRTPSPEFWQPVGENTASMPILDKINLLAYIVPRFGSGDEDQEDSLLAFATGLKPTMALVREKCPQMEEPDVEILSTELLAAEILIPGRSTKSEFVAWLDAMTASELEDILADRKKIDQDAAGELKDFQDAKNAEAKRIEELRQKYNEQVEKARNERSMAFDPSTGTFREIKDKKKKKD